MITLTLDEELESQLKELPEETWNTVQKMIQETITRFLEEEEDRLDAEEADKVYREFMESGEHGIPWETVKAKMDTHHAL